MTCLVRVDLVLDLQHGRGDVVHQICRAHAIATLEAPAEVRIVWVRNRARSRINDGSQVGEVLDGRCGNDHWCEDDAGDVHGCEECVESTLS